MSKRVEASEYEWWEYHKDDTYEGFDGDLEIYLDEPEFVTIAKELLVDGTDMTYEEIIKDIRNLFNKENNNNDNKRGRTV